MQNVFHKNNFVDSSDGYQIVNNSYTFWKVLQNIELNIVCLRVYITLKGVEVYVHVCEQNTDWSKFNVVEILLMLTSIPVN